MPITTTELINSRELVEESTKTSFVRRYAITGVDDPHEAAAQGPQIGDQYSYEGDGGYTETDLFVVRRRVTVDSTAADGTLTLTVYYSKRWGSDSDDQPLEEDRFRTIMDTKRLVVLDDDADRTSYTNFADQASALGSAVNVRDDGEVVGIDVPDPVLEWTVVRYQDALTAANISAIWTALGTINSAEWCGIAAGGARLEDVDVGRRGHDGPWRIVYTWRIRPDHTGDNKLSIDKLTTAGALEATEVSARGWDYVWQYMGEVEGTRGPVVVFVDQIYRETDFTSLPAAPSVWPYSA
jgi:hypothetical protein